MTDLEEDWKRARNVANEVTLNTQTIEDTVVDLVQMYRTARDSRDVLTQKVADLSQILTHLRCQVCGAKMTHVVKMFNGWFECPSNYCPEFQPEDNTGGEYRFTIHYDR